MKLAKLALAGLLLTQPLMAQTEKSADLKLQANQEQKAQTIARRMKDAEFRLTQSKDEAVRKRLYKRYLESQALDESGIVSQFHGGVEDLGGAVALKFLVESCVRGWRAGGSYCHHGRALYKIASEMDQNLGQLFRTMVDNDGDIHKNHASEVNQYGGIIHDLYRDNKRSNARDFVRKARFAEILVQEAVRKFNSGGSYFNRGRDLASQFREVSKHISYAISTMVDNDGDIHKKNIYALKALASIIEDLKNTPDYGGGHGDNHGNHGKVLSLRKARYLINMLEVDRDIEGAVRVLRRAIRRYERENGPEEDW